MVEVGQMEVIVLTTERGMGIRMTSISNCHQSELSKLHVLKISCLDNNKDGF